MMTTLTMLLLSQVEVMHELGAEEAEECLLSMGVDVPILPCTFHVLVQVGRVLFFFTPGQSVNP